MRVYRWDLDKTYLDTDFHSVRGVVRAATEAAHRKRALPGAATLLRALSHADQTKVTVLSGSPTQMQRVLSEKLALDGVRFDEMILKDNVGNVRRGRFRAIRGQLGYKLPALLRARSETPVHATEVLFGDDVEADALVYSVYADAVMGRIGAAQVSRIMEKAGAYPDEIDATLDLLARVDPVEAVAQIFIRQERGVATDRLSDLGRRVVPIRSWWQAGLMLGSEGHIDADAVGAVMGDVYEASGFDPWTMGALAQDVVRRGWLEAQAFDGLMGPSEAVEAVHEAVSMLRGAPVELPREVGHPIDYLTVLSGGGWGRHGQPE